MSNRVHDLTDEQTAEVLSKLEAHLSVENMIKECTPRGKGGAVKTNKPKDGAMAYVWRMARFHNGADTTMPMTAFWDLGKGIEALTGIPLSIAIIRPNVRIVLDRCDQKADALILATGGNPFKAAKVWGRAMGMI